MVVSVVDGRKQRGWAQAVRICADNEVNTFRVRRRMQKIRRGWGEGKEREGALGLVP